MILFGERSLSRAIKEFVSHYHRERNHQGLGNQLILPEHHGAQTDGPIECRQRLGGMLKVLLPPSRLKRSKRKPKLSIGRRSGEPFIIKRCLGDTSCVLACILGKAFHLSKRKLPHNKRGKHDLHADFLHLPNHPGFRQSSF